MLEPARTGNSTLPARLLRTPNQSLVFVVFFAITLRSRTAESQDELRCGAIHKIKRKSTGRIAYATNSTANAESRRDAGATKGEGAQSGDSHNQMLRYSERRASITSMRAARAAGSTDATTAAASKTAAETTTGIVSGMRMSTM